MTESRPTAQVVELRQYTLEPGKRDTLIDLFDSRLLVPQEDCGMSVLGQFRDLDDPDRFVWMRSFTSMASRARSLDAFYRGPVWAAHRDAANATMIDSDNVLLLHDPGGLAESLPRRADAGTDRAGRCIVAIIWTAPRGSAADLQALFERQVAGRLDSIGVDVFTTLATLPEPNNFPRLPVREDVDALVSLGRFAAADDARLVDDPPWLTDARHELAALDGTSSTLRLRPTTRSRMR
jgi:hypothetical protein